MLLSRSITLNTPLLLKTVIVGQQILFEFEQWLILKQTFLENNVRTVNSPLHLKTIVGNQILFEFQVQ